MATVGVALRIDITDKESWELIARSEGLNLQQWIRRVCKLASGQVTGEGLKVLAKELDEVAVQTMTLEEWQKPSELSKELDALTAPAPPKKAKPRLNGVCERHVRMGIKKPIRGCPDCKVVKSVVEGEE